MASPKKKYLIVLDTETCPDGSPTSVSPDSDHSLVYDCGFSVVDLYGNVYEEHSYIIKEIYCDRKDLMSSAYYASKIPQYENDIKKGERTIITFWNFRKRLLDTIDKYGVENVVAHNARFDRDVLNATQKYISASKYKHFFPKDKIDWWDTMKMARSVVCKKPTYVKFCQDNGLMTKHTPPQAKASAEALYAFITKDPSFVESHTALEDVQIEREILWYCIRQHKPMKRLL